MIQDELTDREQKVLEAVVKSYVDNAEPAGSRTIAKTFQLGISAATIRNTMADLEDRGYLFHPHTSAGRVPTDRAYRFYVDEAMRRGRVTVAQEDLIQRELAGHTAIDTILNRAADVLGVLTQELGLASPSFNDALLEQLELIQVSSERLLMVLVLKGAVARTLYVEVDNELPREAVESVARVLNERLGGLSLEEIRRSVRQRLQDTAELVEELELINIFVEEADQLFTISDEPLVLGPAKLLAGQPEFASNEKMRELIELTQQPFLLQDALKDRSGRGLTLTIGGENVNPKLTSFTIVTSTYRRGSLTGVLGVMGPTRMPYDKVVPLVEYTSRLVNEMIESP
jgi:heat-inducible transcriptional repressor